MNSTLKVKKVIYFWEDLRNALHFENIENLTKNLFYEEPINTTCLFDLEFYVRTELSS